MDTSGKTAFITGAASGIGLATAVALAERGGSVALGDVSAAGLDEAERAVRAAGAPRVTKHRLDVSKSEEVERTCSEVLEAHGGVEIVYANAGVAFLGVPLSRTRSSDARWMMGVNFMGVYDMARVLLPSMIASGRPGIFMCTSSVAALGHDPGGHGSLYTSTKTAIAALTEGIREECGEAPIHVAAVYPGPVRTNIVASVETLRPPGGVPMVIPDALMEIGNAATIGADMAAKIILEGLDAGLTHIFTHPDMAEMFHRRHSETITGQIERSKSLGSAFRSAPPVA